MLRLRCAILRDARHIQNETHECRSALSLSPSESQRFRGRAVQNGSPIPPLHCTMAAWLLRLKTGLQSFGYRHINQAEAPGCRCLGALHTRLNSAGGWRRWRRGGIWHISKTALCRGTLTLPARMVPMDCFEEI